jgi:hypothetical protein
VWSLNYLKQRKAFLFAKADFVNKLSRYIANEISSVPIEADNLLFHDMIQVTCTKKDELLRLVFHSRTELL